MRTAILSLACLTLAGCVTPPMSPPMSTEYSQQAGLVETTETPSLFSSDASVMSDADITRILAHKSGRSVAGVPVRVQLFRKAEVVQA
jgi:hypothetical protein